MIVGILWFLLAMGGLFVLAAAIKGTKSSAWFLVIGGAIFLLMGNMVFYSGIEVRDGFSATEIKEGPNTTTITRDLNYSTYLIDEDRNNWIGMLTIIAGVILILFGAGTRFM